MHSREKIVQSGLHDFAVRLVQKVVTVGQGFADFTGMFEIRGLVVIRATALNTSSDTPNCASPRVNLPSQGLQMACSAVSVPKAQISTLASVSIT